MRMDFSTIPVNRIYPIAGVFDDVVVNRKGRMTVGWELSLPVVFSRTEKEYDLMQAAFASAVRSLPPWTVVHRQDMYTFDTYHAQPSGSFLGRSYERTFEGRRYLRHRAYLFLTLGTRLLSLQAEKSSGVFGLHDTLTVPSREEFEVWRYKCDEFMAVVQNSGMMTARLLHEADWLGDEDDPGIVHRAMMLGEGEGILGDIAVAPDGVSVADRVAQVYLVSASEALPASMPSVMIDRSLSRPGISEVFLSSGASTGVLLECEHMVNNYFVVPVQEEVSRSLERKRKKMQGSSRSVDNRLNGEEIQSCLDDSYNGTVFFVRTHSNVIAWTSPEEVPALSGQVQAAFKKMNVTAKFDSYDAPVVWYAAIPSMGCDLGAGNLMTQNLDSSLCMCTWETFEDGIPGGNFRVCDRMRNVPIDVDLQKTAQALGWIFNYNQFVLGATGSGKSFYMNNYLRNCFDRGQDVFIIDVGDSYLGQTTVIEEELGSGEAAYMSWDVEHPLTFDAFDGWEGWMTDDGALRCDEDSSNFFMSLLRTMWEPVGGWTDQRTAVLMQIVTEFLTRWKESGKGHPVFDDFYNFVNDVVNPRISYVSSWEKVTLEAGDREGAEALARDREEDYRANGWWIGSVPVHSDMFNCESFTLALRNYSRQGSYVLFNDPSPRDIFSCRWTVVEVARLSKSDPKYYAVCILAILNAFSLKMQRKGGMKTMCIDEAWKAIANRSMSEFLRSLWKTARKYSTSAIVVTQELDDIIGNDVIKSTILDNSAIKVLLDQSNQMEKFGRLQKELSLTDKDRSIVLSLNRNNRKGSLYREAFIKLGSEHSIVVASEVSPEEALVYESAYARKEPVLERKALVGSYIEAVRQIAEENRNKNTQTAVGLAT